MEKHNFPFDARLLETGYVCVSRSVLRTVCSPGYGQSAARILLCIQTNAYFKAGRIRVDKFSFACQPGEWITSCSEIAACLDMNWHTVKKTLDVFARLGWLTLTKLGNYVRISLTYFVPPRPAGNRQDDASFTLSGDTDPYQSHNIYSGGRR